MKEPRSQIRNLDRYLTSEKQPRLAMSAAIRLKCLDCCGNLANEVRECTCYNCPLWSVRFGAGYFPVPETGWAGVVQAFRDHLKK